MEDIKLILYILAAVAYFVFMQWRKAFNAPKDDADVEPRRQERRPPAPPRPVTSFEDILRELQPKMQQEKDREKKVLEKPVKPAEPIPLPAFPEPVTEKAPKPKYRNYEDVVPKVLSWEKPAEARQMARQSEEKRKRLRVYEPEKVTAARTSKYASLLRNPATVREAVILSEIFNRKYN